MQETYSFRLEVNPATKNPRKGIYLKLRLITKIMSVMPGLEVRFQQYRFQWMTSVPGRFTLILVHKFYVPYKGELKR